MLAGSERAGVRGCDGTGAELGAALAGVDGADFEHREKQVGEVFVDFEGGDLGCALGVSEGDGEEVALLAGADHADDNEGDDSEVVSDLLACTELGDAVVGHGDVGLAGGVEDEAGGDGGIELADDAEVDAANGGGEQLDLLAGSGVDRADREEQKSQGDEVFHVFLLVLSVGAELRMGRRDEDSFECVPRVELRKRRR
jgi:hypothetical protein